MPQLRKFGFEVEEWQTPVLLDFGRAEGAERGALAFMPVGGAAKSIFVSAAMCGMIAASLAAAAYFALVRVVSRGGGYMLSTEIRASSDFIVSSDGGLGTRNSTASV